VSSYADSPPLTAAGRLWSSRRGKTARSADGDAESIGLDELLSPRRWVWRTRDPELRKVLGALQSEVGETRGLLARSGASRRTRANERHLVDLLRQRVGELNVDAGWELVGELKRVNLRLGDRSYIASRLEYEQSRNKAKGRWHSWGAHFTRRELDDLVKTYRAGAPDRSDRALALDRLNSLYLMRMEAGRDRRAKAALKTLYLKRLALVLVGLLVVLVMTVSMTAGDARAPVLLAASAGALGSTLSGIFAVRDQLVRLDELRGFAPAMRVQPLVGACAGLFALLVLQSNVVSIGPTIEEPWSTQVLLAFAAGFSEPFFLGLVKRVTVLSEQAADAKAGGSR
jgi:hypothetical protein